MAIPSVVLKNHFNEVSGSHNHKRLGTIWVPVRPENYKPDFTNLKSRIKDAWGVLTGRYDAIDWNVPD